MVGLSPFHCVRNFLSKHKKKLQQTFFNFYLNVDLFFCVDTRFEFEHRFIIHRRRRRRRRRLRHRRRHQCHRRCRQMTRISRQKRDWKCFVAGHLKQLQSANRIKLELLKKVNLSGVSL